MQGNVNLPGQDITESLLHVSFQRSKIRRQNHNRFHRICVNIAIIHYIISNLIIYCSSFDYVLVILFLYKKCHL